MEKLRMAAIRRRIAPVTCLEIVSMTACGWNASPAGRAGLRTPALTVGMALLLVVLGLGLEGCRKKSEGPAAPTTSLTLVGTDTATGVSGNRFGAAPPRDPSSQVFDLLSSSAQRQNGAKVVLSSSTGGTTFYDINQTGCPPGAYTQYDPANPPTVGVATTFGQSLPPSEAWFVCYYSTSGGQTEAAKTSIIYFDTMTPEVQLLDSQGVNRFVAGAVPFTQFPTLKPAYNESTTATPAGVDATTILTPTGGTIASSTLAFFPNESGTVYYTTDGSNPITPRQAQVFGLTASKSIPIVKGVGQGTFPFSSFQRLVNIVSVDDVGNESAIQSLAVPMDLVATDPSAGYYNTPQDIKLVPPTNDFDSAVSSAAYVLLCRYSTVTSYQCSTGGPFAPTFAVPAVPPVPEAQQDSLPGVTANVYLYGTPSPANNPTFNLAGTAGETTVYDLKILNDSYLGDGATVTDADHQALFILDRDLPDLKVYADPDKTTDSALTVGASWYDDGYLVLKEAAITDYSVTRDLTQSCTLIINATTQQDACVKPAAPTVALPASPFALPTDNSPVNVTATATDAAGNVAQASAWQPIGRSYVEGSGNSVSGNLGYAMTTGNFNTASNRSGVVTESAPDYAIAEPSKNGDTGSVYIFYDDVRTQVRFDSGNTTLTPFVALASPIAVNATTNNTVILTTTVNGTTVGPLTVDLTSRAFLPTSVTGTYTLAQVADSFNKAVMSLAHQGTDLGVYMVATDHDKNGTKDSVALFSDTGQIDTCVTIGGGTLAAALQLASTTQCIWDERIDGGAAGDQFGHGLAVGDFNNDGYADLVVGAPGAGGGAGAVYIFYSAGTDLGKGEFTGAQYTSGVVNAALPPSVAAASTISGNAGDELGWAVAAGDLNPNVADLQFIAGVDSKDDLAMGAPGATVSAAAGAGRVYVVQAPGAGAVALPATTVTTGTSYYLEDPGIGGLPAAGDRFGHAILISDLKVDSVIMDEMVVGAPGVKFLQDTSSNAGAAYLYNSPGAALALVRQDAQGANVDSKFGWALANAGVLYGDVCSPGAKCLAVGAPGARDAGGTGTQKGAAYIGPPGYFSGSVASGPYRVLGSNAGDLMGTGFASADLNADSRPELFIGQGGSKSNISTLTAFYGGIGIVKGGNTAPNGPLTPLTFDRHFPDLDVDPVNGQKVETRIGAAMLATAADPVNQGGVITRLIVGAPGGQHLFPLLGAPVPGRLHVFHRSTFNY